MNNLKIGGGYMACRLAAMPSTAGLSIPDGRSGRHVNACFWNKSTLTFTAGQGQTNVYLLPWLPAPLGISGGTFGTTLINGAGVSSSITGNMTGWCASSNLYGTGDAHYPGNVSLNPYNADKIRFSSIGMRIRYTGPAQTAAGMLSVFKMPLSLYGPETTTATAAAVTPPTAGNFCTRYYAAGTVTGFTPVGVDMYKLSDEYFTSSTPSCNVQMFRPEQGVVVRLSHSGDFKHVPWMSTAAAPVREDATADKAVLAQSDCVMSNDSILGRSTGGLYCFDNDWTPVCVQFNGCNNDASFLIETCVCAEIQPQPDSAMATVALEGSKAHEAELVRTEKLLESQGPALPLFGPR